jgi:hypothetical protein
MMLLIRGVIYRLRSSSGLQRSFITMFTRASQRGLSWAIWIQSTCFNHISVSKSCPATVMQVTKGRGVLILDLGTRWKWVFSVTHRPRFTPTDRTPGAHWIGSWVDHRGRRRSWERTTVARSSSFPDTILTWLHQLLYFSTIHFNIIIPSTPRYSELSLPSEIYSQHYAGYTFRIPPPLF